MRPGSGPRHRQAQMVFSIHPARLSTITMPRKPPSSWTPRKTAPFVICWFKQIATVFFYLLDRNQRKILARHSFRRKIETGPPALTRPAAPFSPAEFPLRKAPTSVQASTAPQIGFSPSYNPGTGPLLCHRSGKLQFVPRQTQRVCEGRHLLQHRHLSPAR